MESDKTYLEKWNQMIAGMSMDDLLKIVMNEDGCYYAEFVRMARHRLYNDYRMIKQLDENERRLSDDEKQKESYDPLEQTEVLDLLRYVLEEIGCRIEERAEDEICFRYEGERFFAYASNIDNIITIYDCWEEVCKLDDEEYIAIVKETINNANQNTFETFFYGTDAASNVFAVRCSRDIYITPENLDLGTYIRMALDSFFRAQRFFDNELDRLWKETNNSDTKE